MFGGWCFYGCGYYILFNSACSCGKCQQCKWQTHTIRWVRLVVKPTSFKALCLYTGKKKSVFPFYAGRNQYIQDRIFYSLQIVQCTQVKNENLPWGNNLKFCFGCSDTLTGTLMWLLLPTVLWHVICPRELHRLALNLLVSKWVVLLPAEHSCESWFVRSV